MAWDAPWRKEHDVDLHIVAGLEIVVRDAFRSFCDASETAFVNSKIELRIRRTCLDLNENHEAGLAGDEVNLSGPCAHTPCQYPPPLETQPPSRNSLALSPALFRRETGGRFHCAFNSSARA
jgi:hypothetical protein